MGLAFETWHHSEDTNAITLAIGGRTDFAIRAVKLVTETGEVDFDVEVTTESVHFDVNSFTIQDLNAVPGTFGVHIGAPVETITLRPVDRSEIIGGGRSSLRLTRFWANWLGK